MRRFLNAVIVVKQKFSDILPMIYKIMEENQWVEERRLFFMEDLNDAKTENRTPHAMMCKAFPQMASYWHSAKKNKEKKAEYFSNFPGYMNGKVVFMPENKEITRDFLKNMAAKIPKPCSFFQTNIVLDGIRWNKECNTDPAIDWQEVQNYPDNEFLPGEIYAGSFFIHAMFYQSNSIFLEKGFDMKPELRILIEITEKFSRKEALAIVEEFQKVFGTPKQTYTKIYTISVPPWKDREYLIQQTKRMQEWYNLWCQETICKLREFIENKKVFMQKDIKTPGIKTLQKKFLKEQKLVPHNIRPWDDHGWCRQLVHNFWIYVELVVKPIEQNNLCLENDRNNYMRISCYGDNFHLFDHISMRSFITDPSDIKRNLIFDGYALYLKLFEEEVVPKLAELFGDTDKTFYQESKEMDVYWQQNILGAWMDERRRAGEHIW